MRAAILAGGKGTRIGQRFPDLPKPMIPVAGKPLLQHQVELLARQGITDITLIIGYKSEIIQKHFGDGAAFGARIDYIIEDKPLGTGGALSLLPREETLILFGDIYLDIDFRRFIRFYKEKQAGIALFAHPNSHPQDSDILVADGNARVLAWKSKKDGKRGELRNLVNAGLYVFSRDALPEGDAVKRDLEHDLIVPMIPEGRAFAYRSTEYVKDMGTPERLDTVSQDIGSGAAAARNLKNRQRAVFLDRDGTINEENGFVTGPEQIQLIPGSAEAIKRLNRSPFLVICVTNQPVIARGDVTFDGLEAIHACLDTLLGREGAYMDDLFFCPHHPDGGFAGELPEYKTNCSCRKPEPGLLLQAAERYNIDLRRSYMIGDRTSDIAAGRTAGCMSIGLRTGAALTDGKYDADAVCDDLLHAVDWIRSRENI